MAINLAVKYEKKTSDLMKARGVYKFVTNTDWSWDGVNAINVYTLTDPTVGNYDVNGGSERYGAPTEVEDTLQTWTLSRDRSWSKIMDKLNQQDSMGVRKASAYLAQAVKNVMVPEIDTYVIGVIYAAGDAAGRDDLVTDSATSASNAYSNFTAINAAITNSEAPTEGRVALLTPAYVAFLKQSTTLDSSDASYADKKSGVLGTLDGVKLVQVPSSRMPANTDLIITHPSACVAPEKLVDYKVHNNPPGISGDRIDYRHRYDAFVDTNRVNCIGIHKTA